MIHSLAEEVFPATYQSILTPDQIEYMMHWMYDVESLQRQMTEDGHVYFIAHANLTPAGYVSVRPDGADVFHLEKIYVLPKFQQAHCGNALFCHALSYVKTRCPGVRALELNVNRNNPALSFYFRMGMHIDREVDAYIGNGFYMNDYIMRMEL
ncbi:MAG: GNAT family N-acetyltransferase [Paraprevotella sp.]|nr:GNAT family N-acetyltransferase [Paraprevotella sp.]